MAKTFNLKSFIINTLRKASYRFPPRNESMKNARIERGKYRWNNCKGSFGPKEINVDHINPVIGEDGFISWDRYIERMFPNIEGFQVLCKICHDVKTEQEDNIRKVYRYKNKALTKRKKKVKV
jgi:hypothetical protein